MAYIGILRLYSKYMVGNTHTYKAIAHKPALIATPKQTVAQIPTGVGKPAHVNVSIPVTANINPAAVRQSVV